MAEQQDTAAGAAEMHTDGQVISAAPDPINNPLPIPALAEHKHVHEVTVIKVAPSGAGATAVTAGQANRGPGMYHLFFQRRPEFLLRAFSAAPAERDKDGHCLKIPGSSPSPTLAAGRITGRPTPRGLAANKSLSLAAAAVNAQIANARLPSL